jgi:hypothetical protein
MKVALLSLLALLAGAAGGYRYRDYAVRKNVDEAWAYTYTFQRQLERKDPTRCREQVEKLVGAFEACAVGNEPLKAATKVCDDAVAAGTFKYKSQQKLKQPGTGTR